MFYHGIIYLLEQAFLRHVLLISFTGMFFIYKRLLINKKSIIILRAIDYKIDSLFDFYFSFMILISYFSIFFIGIIILRLHSLGQSIDLWLLVLTIRDFYKSHSLLYSITYISYILCIIVWLILLLKYIHKTVRFHANRLHILFCDSSQDSTPYNKIPTFALDYYHNFSLIISRYIESILPIKYYAKYRGKIFIKLAQLEENLSFFLLLLGAFYDIVFNNMTLHYLFYLLPFILIYKLYRDVLYFYYSRSYFEDYDCALYCMIYYESLLKVENAAITLTSVEEYIQRDFKPIPIA